MTTELKTGAAIASRSGVAPRTKGQPSRPSRWGPLLLIPTFMPTLFTGAVIGMYFQPPGLRAFFNTTGLEPSIGINKPTAVAIKQVTAHEKVAVISEGDVVALGRIIAFRDTTACTI